MKRRKPNFHGTEATHYIDRVSYERPPSLTHRRRRYGRGQSGGQVRDDRRVTYDPARDARRGADVVDAPAPAPAAVPEEEPAAETVSGAKKRLRDDDDDESEDD
uniref:Nuclear cap-binding protein subunit 2 n=1 Tax=Pelagomonas calceolata TaxID=35677 RepID=A0A7S3ZNK6_9STRA|mmetsp:Transcript_3238/g.7376  ORF Transcript_3238/g.7376 Transcript_3238/m.7376 type:complete len:104 (+) Transcript_3238:92-403(+)